ARARIARQLLTESVILALTGGLFGTLLAFWAVDLLSALSPSAVSKVTRIKVDARVLLFTLGFSILTGLVFGLAPAVRASVLNLHDSLKDGGRSPAADTAGARIRRVLVVVEVALSLVLLIVSGLLIRSFKQLTAVNPGLEPDHVLTANLLLPFGPGSTYNSPERQTGFFRSAVSGLEASPGIESAGATTSLPLSGAVESTPFNIEGRFAADPAQMPVADYASVTDHFFKALGIPLIEGRQFTERDTMQSPGVVIINQTMARRNWPGEKAVGKRITTASAPGPGVQWMTVVGVVGDVRQMKLGEPPDSAMYFPYEQNPSPFMTLAVRARSNASSIAETVRQKVWSVDKDQPVSDTRTMSQILTDSVAAPRFNMLLLTIFAVVALVLASVGIYGAISYSVTQRTHEIGVRMALGATRRDVVALISGQAAGLSLAGAGLG
ncbi:MAG: FtsX-like permease family protein, partial [Blastocatellia bacterium]